jgi:uncharacterized membrane protein
MEYLAIKWAHILFSTLLFGTGLGTAFFMFFTNRSKNVQAISVVTRLVALADWCFTTPTIILQPLSGYWMMRLAGYPLHTPWIMWSFALYLLAGACWLPVVWLQLRMRAMAQLAAAQGQPLPPRYWRYEKIWTALGVPAFFALVAVYWLMVHKPA